MLGLKGEEREETEGQAEESEEREDFFLGGGGGEGGELRFGKRGKGETKRKARKEKGSNFSRI